MRKVSVLASLLVLVSPFAAQAAPSEILGEGVATCNEYMAQPNMQSVRLEWVLGYISGQNSQSGNVTDRMTGKSIHDAITPVVWLQNYCKANGLNPLIVAADTLRIELQQREK